MVVELINTGSELMLGRVLNTHQQWLCRKLADLGMVVSRQVAVPDRGPDIQNALRESLGRADLIIATGGLGPTSDDITRDLIAELLGRELIEDSEIVDYIRGYFTRRGRQMPESTRVQARVPKGALVLHNANGTAPGLAIRVDPNTFRSGGQPSWLIMLPGPPRELRPMFMDSVVPLLRQTWPDRSCICRTIRTCGVGESVVEERIGKFLLPYVEKGLELGYCARTGEVDVRLVVYGADAETLVRSAEQIVRRELGAAVYGADDQELEDVVVQALTRRGETLAIAESCTGGLISHRITNVPGASAVLLAGIVSYANEAKRKFLGVPEATFKEHGAVSEVCARQMAEGVRSATGATYAISVTGIAGPGGGTPEKPVGTAFIGFAGPSGTMVLRQFNSVDRQTFKQVTAQQVFTLLLGHIENRKHS